MAWCPFRFAEMAFVLWQMKAILIHALPMGPKMVMPPLDFNLRPAPNIKTVTLSANSLKSVFLKKLSAVIPFFRCFWITQMIFPSTRADFLADLSKQHSEGRPSHNHIPHMHLVAVGNSML